MHEQQIPNNPETLLTREATAAALTAAGFPIKAKTLATKVSRGGGPAMRSFGGRVLYRWGDALEWAQGRLSPPRCSSSEVDAQEQRVTTMRKAAQKTQPQASDEPEDVEELGSFRRVGDVVSDLVKNMADSQGKS